MDIYLQSLPQIRRSFHSFAALSSVDFARTSILSQDITTTAGTLHDPSPQHIGFDIDCVLPGVSTWLLSGPSRYALRSISLPTTEGTTHVEDEAAEWLPAIRQQIETLSVSLSDFSLEGQLIAHLNNFPRSSLTILEICCASESGPDAILLNRLLGGLLYYYRPGILHSSLSDDVIPIMADLEEILENSEGIEALRHLHINVDPIVLRALRYNPSRLFLELKKWHITVIVGNRNREPSRADVCPGCTQRLHIPERTQRWTRLT